jgi:prepilin-type N-terminal cleavage/methylation domain-containing protein
MNHKIHKHNSNCNKQKGFTLIELLVAIAIFVVAITSASAIFIAVIRSQQKSNIQRQTSQDARYAMETITREVRMATGSDTEPAISTGEFGQTLIIVNIDSVGDKYVKYFWLDGDKIVIKIIKNSVIQVIKQPITSGNLKVIQFDLKNIVNYVPPAKPAHQPSVTITITSQQISDSPQVSEQSKTTLRTTISSRDYLYDK